MQQIEPRVLYRTMVGAAAWLACALALPVQADERLPVAAMERDLDSVRGLLAERGADVNALGPYATPALHWIVRIEDLDLASQLLDAGADPDLRNAVGMSALSLAIENGDLDMVQLLLQHGADVHESDRAGETPLMQAARSGNPDIVQALLDHGAEVDPREPNYQQTALMIGVRSGSAAVVDLLITAGANVNAQGVAGPTPRFRLPSESAASRGVGVNRGGWPERGQRTPIAGAKTPLLYATRQGNLEVTKLLVAAGADLEQSDANGVTPLVNAILNATVATQPGRTTQHIDVARYLLEHGADLNARDWYGHTALWAAVDLRNLDVSGPTRDNRIDRAAAFDLIKTLLEQGADPNARIQELSPDHRWVTRLGSLSWVDFTGQTPFLRAALAGDVATMKLLVAHGADPNLATFNGSTPLMAAAGVNWTVSQTFDEGPEALLEAVKLAHALGNDVNAQNALGFAAIHGAANRGSDDIIRWLAANGARLDITDAVGRTPVDWAHGVFLATHPPVDRPETVALIETLLAQDAVEPTAAEQQARYDAMPDTPGTGRFPAIKETDPGLPGQVIYRPADLAALGDTKLGVYAFGNGSCTDDAAHSRLHLLEVASHGWLVIVPGALYSGPGAIERPANLPPAGPDAVLTTPAQLGEAITWALAENARAGSAYFGLLDPAAIAVSGFSCGGLQALFNAGDPRVGTVVMMNSGLFPDSTTMAGMTADKSLLQTLHTSILYVLGGETDIAWANGMDDFARINHVPAAAANIDKGHGGTYWEANGGPAAQVVVQWLNWQLRGDAEAGRMFIGSDCGLCRDPAWSLETKGL